MERSRITEEMPAWVARAEWQVRIAWNEGAAWRKEAESASPLVKGSLILWAKMQYTTDAMDIIRPQE